MVHASAAFPSHWVLLLEAALVLAGLALAASGFEPLTRAGRAARRVLRVMARRPLLSITALALASAFYLAAHTAISGAPVPRVVDEWSYLVAADTFAHNRLANPPHPMAAHFEAPHLLQRPTYASKYPPAQGFALAVGQVAFGHPAAGLWLEAALLVAATGWMLCAWVPPSWAIFGALLVALRLGAGNYWNESYWGGSIAAIGGALLFGAARRLWRRVHPLDAVLLALGVGLLAVSRPYEGLLVTLPVGALLGTGLVLGRLRPEPWLRLVVPAGLLLAATLAGMATLNRAVTGDPLQFPHQLYTRQQGLPPLFVWLPDDDRAPAAVGGNAGADGSANAESAESAESVAWRKPRTSGWHRLAVGLYFFLGLSGVLALTMTRGAVHDPWSRFAALAFLVVAAGHFLIGPWWPHYVAPALGALLVPAIQGHRHLYAARRSGRSLGPALFAVACVSQLAVFAIQIPSQRPDASDPSRQRARIAWEFEQRPGKHLLLLRYPPGWVGDWTYNRADIDAAKVVWANDLGEAANAELLTYYNDRTAWRLEVPFTDVDPVPTLLRPTLDPGGATHTE